MVTRDAAASTWSYTSYQVERAVGSVSSVDITQRVDTATTVARVTTETPLNPSLTRRLANVSINIIGNMIWFLNIEIYEMIMR